MAFAETVPLPTELAGVRVTLNGLDAALFYVDANQINFQVPTSLPAEGQYTIIVFRNGQAGAPATVDAAGIRARRLPQQALRSRRSRSMRTTDS